MLTPQTTATLPLTYKKLVNVELSGIRDAINNSNSSATLVSSKPIKLNIYPGVLEQCKDNVIHQAPVGWIYVGRSNVHVVMEILEKITDQSLENADDDSPITSVATRIVERNLIMTVSPNTAPFDYITAVIKNQNKYFTSLEYKYVSTLSPPDTVLHLKDNSIHTFCTVLLNMTNTLPTPGQYNLFTQVDRGMTIKTQNRQGRPPIKGLTFTFQQSASEEALKAIENLSAHLKKIVKESSHHLLFPDALPTQLITSPPQQSRFKTSI